MPVSPPSSPRSGVTENLRSAHSFNVKRIAIEACSREVSFDERYWIKQEYEVNLRYQQQCRYHR